MSDHDADPMDKAYAQAEAVLDDEAARVARRARVLAAVASEPAVDDAPAPPTRRPAFGPGGWLVAASVAGLSALIAVQIYEPTQVPRPSAPVIPTAPAAAPKTASPAPAAPAPARAPQPPSRPGSAAVSTEPAPPSAGFAAAPPPPAPPPPPPQPALVARQPAAPPAEAPASPPPSRGVEEMVVTGSRAAAPARIAPPRAAAAKRKPADDVSEVVVTAERRRSADEAVPVESPATQARRLRRAAASGKVDEVSALLEAGAEVDAADGEGVTALMRAVQRKHAEAALLLRDYGADLDRKNRAGVSARDMAAKLGDPELNRALGLER